MKGAKRMRAWISVLTLTFVLLASLQLETLQASATEEDGIVENKFYRAFWVQAFEAGLKTPEQIDQLVADVKNANMNAIVAQVVRRHDAYYQSDYLPFTQDPAVAPGFDPLGYLIQKAHEEGIEVHAWAVLGPMWHSIYGGAPQDPNHIYNVYGPSASDADTWITKGYDDSIGNVMQPYLDFGHPDVINHFVNMLTDIVENYDVDGIHIDYVRYPENPSGRAAGWYGYNPTALQRFQAETGRTDRPEPTDQEWLEWKVKQVDLAVKRMYLEVTDVKMDTVFSAAVLSWGFADPRTNDWWRLDPVQRAHQNWKKWVQEGYLDYTFVMNYDSDADPNRAARYDAWIEWQKDLPRNRGMVIGPALYLNTIPNSLSQINRALAPSAAGNMVEGISPYVYNVWSSDSSPRIQLLESLIQPTEWNQGVVPFAEAVEVPEHAWKKASNGHLLGQFINRDGQAQSGVILKVRNAETGASVEIEVETDSNGYFGVTDLPTGVYYVSYPGGVSKELIHVQEGIVTRTTITTK